MGGPGHFPLLAVDPRSKEQPRDTSEQRKGELLVCELLTLAERNVGGGGQAMRDLAKATASSFVPPHRSSTGILMTKSSEAGVT